MPTISVPHPDKPAWPYYVAYGTLMKGYERHHLIEPYVSFVHDVTFGGTLYNYHDAFPMWYRYGGGLTEGELYEIIPGSIEVEDFYEMLDEVEAEGLLFFREEQFLVVENHETGYVNEYTATIYEGKTQVMDKLITVPSGSWKTFKGE